MHVITLYYAIVWRHTAREWTNEGDNYHQGEDHITSINAVRLFLFLAVLAIGVVSMGMAGQPKGGTIKLYEGQIKSVRIDKCGLQPGSCEGSIVLADKGGTEVVLAILPGTWIKRGDRLALIDELSVGNYVKAQATAMPIGLPGSGTVGSSPGEQAYLLEETGKGD
jgi:hypothetical protein